MNNNTVSISRLLLKGCIYAVGITLGGKVSFLAARAVSDDFRVVFALGAVFLLLVFLGLRFLIGKIPTAKE